MVYAAIALATLLACGLPILLHTNRLNHDIHASHD